MITKGNNSAVNLRKWTCNNPNLGVVKVNTYANLGLIPSIRSSDIERKRNSGDKQRSLLCYKFAKIDA